MIPVLPAPPDAPTAVPMSDGLRAYLTGAIARFDLDLVRALRQVLAELAKVPVWFGWTPLDGADGVRTTFTLPVVLWLDQYKRPLVVVMQGGAVAPWVDADPPPPGCWTLRLGPPQVMVFGTAPLATDAIVQMAVAPQGANL